MDFGRAERGFLDQPDKGVAARKLFVPEHGIVLPAAMHQVEATHAGTPVNRLGELGLGSAIGMTCPLFRLTNPPALPIEPRPSRSNSSASAWLATTRFTNSD